MISAIVALVGGAGLSGLSLLRDSEEKCDEAASAAVECPGFAVSSSDGFPFSFISEQPVVQSGTSFLETQFELAPAVANFVFWAIVAIVVFKLLAWVLETFSTLIFGGVLIFLIAAYVGVVQPF